MIRYLNYAVLAACLVATVVVGLWLSGRAVRPLREVSEVTRHLEQGHLDIRSIADVRATSSASSRRRSIP